MEATQEKKEILLTLNFQTFMSYYSLPWLPSVLHSGPQILLCPLHTGLLPDINPVYRGACWNHHRALHSDIEVGKVVQIFSPSVLVHSTQLSTSSIKWEMLSCIVLWGWDYTAGYLPQCLRVRPQSRCLEYRQFSMKLSTPHQATRENSLLGLDTGPIPALYQRPPKSELPCDWGEWPDASPRPMTVLLGSKV